MTLYKSAKNTIERIYYVYVKNGYEIDFVTEGINDKRLDEFPKIKKMINFLSNIEIYDDDKEFLNLFLDYPFLHTDEVVRYTYYIKSENDKVDEQIAIYNVDLIKANLNISKLERFSEEIFLNGIIESAIRISNYDIEPSMLEIVKENKQNNLYLLVGDKKFHIPKLELIKPCDMTDELNYISFFPFKHEKDQNIEEITSEIDSSENIVFFIPKYLENNEKKIKRDISKYFEYSKRNYVLNIIDTKKYGSFYLPFKSLKKNETKNKVSKK